MIHMDTNIYIPSLDKRLHKIETNITDLKEDVDSIKIGLGYKEKSNGEFRESVEAQETDLQSRLLALEKSNVSLESTVNTAVTSMRLTIGIGFGGIISVIMLLLSLHL